MSEAKGNDGTDRAQRYKLDEDRNNDPEFGGFKFDSEVVLEEATKFGTLQGPLEEAFTALAEHTEELIAMSQQHVEPYWAYVMGDSGPRVPPNYRSAVDKADTAMRRVNETLQYTAQSLHATGEAYYEEDRNAYLRWKKLGNDVDDLTYSSKRDRLVLPDERS